MKPPWDSPLEWLEQASKRWSKERLREEFLSVVGLCDSESLEEDYRDAMAADGYFEPSLEPDELIVGLRVKVRRGCDLIMEGEHGVIEHKLHEPTALPYLVRLEKTIGLVAFSALELTSPTYADPVSQTEVEAAFWK